VNKTEPLATSVLISLPGAGANAPSILGKTLPVRQLEYAAAQGCGKVILLGRGAPSDAMAIRQSAEGKGLRLVEVSGAHALAAAVAEDESLLVLQHNLLPAWDDWVKGDAARGTILTLPATAGRDAGFERIDLARAWAGALVIPGRYLSTLLELPEETEPAPAILRIALQARLPERSLEEAFLGDGNWSAVSNDADLSVIEEQWLTQHAQSLSGTSLSDLIAGFILRKNKEVVFSRKRVPLALLVLSMVLAIGAGGVAYLGHGLAGFGLLGLASLLHPLALEAKRLRELPFPGPSSWPKAQFLLDIAFLVTGFFSIGGSLAARIFLPFVLLAAFHSAPVPARKWQARIRDRTLVFALVGLAGIFVGAERALMLFAAVLLALNLLLRHVPKG
jgi:hypothetical protein